MPNIYLVGLTLLLINLFCQPGTLRAQPRIVPIAKAWAKTSVNAVIFRRNAVVSHEGWQYVAFYDANGTVVLAKRQLGNIDWSIRKTPYRGDVKDAHNSISIMVDGGGYLHMAWDHHNSRLRYCRSVSPGSLDLTDEIPMTGKKESEVTYPEFHRLPNGNLLFLYRDGSSGRGNVMLNRYDIATRSWTQLQDGFISGENQRNAYWQAAVDGKGTVHISWVWRETWDVATNHDICYTGSVDGGTTWLRSTGEVYQLPVTAAKAEYAHRVPQSSELINQTSMCVDSLGRPYIATYWRPPGTDVPQFHLVYHDGREWRLSQVSKRATPFSLSGGGTKRIPISRPLIVAHRAGPTDRAYMIFRDIERQNRVSVAICGDISKGHWRVEDLTTDSVGQWEPSYDTELWARSRTLHLFVQRVGQGDAESEEELPPQTAGILEWQP